MGSGNYSRAAGVNPPWRWRVWGGGGARAHPAPALTADELARAEQSRADEEDGRRQGCSGRGSARWMMGADYAQDSSAAADATDGRTAARCRSGCFAAMAPVGPRESWSTIGGRDFSAS